MALHRIGNYELLGELGRGGMGVVYRGVDSFIKRPVAIKTIYLTEIQDKQEREFLRERLYREAQSAGILSHPNIVTIYQVGEADEITYIAMEFVDGPNLAEVMRQKQQEKTSLESLAWIFEQTALGLDHAHSQGVIHRDIKPANIIVRNDGVAKITDFGVAKITSQTVTRTGITLGTPHFMAPEQIQGKKLDGRADQYSLGVVMYEAITGKRPFTAESMTTLIFKIVSDPVDPRRDNPNISDAVSEVLKKALAKNAEDRFPNCEALARSFREALGFGAPSGFSTASHPGEAQAGIAGTHAYRSGMAGQPGRTMPMPFPPPSQAKPLTTRGAQPSRTAHTATPVATPTPFPPPLSAPTPMPMPPSAGAGTPSSAGAGIDAGSGATPHPASGWAPPAPRMAYQASVSGTDASAVFAGAPTSRNRWLAPVLVLAGLALVTGIFGIFKLLNDASGAVDSANEQTTELARTVGPDPSLTGGESALATEISSGSVPTVSVRAGTTVPPATTATLPAAGSTASPATMHPAAAANQAPRNVSTNAAAAKAGVPRIQIAGSQPPTAAVTPNAAVVTSSGAVAQPVPNPGGSAASGIMSNPADPSAAAVPVPPGTAKSASAPPVVVAPRPTLRIPAVYPAAARRDGVSGTVTLRAVVDALGQPTNIEVRKGIRADLDKAATDALAKWRFQPGTSDGMPVDSRVNVEIRFSLVQDGRKPVRLGKP